MKSELREKNLDLFFVISNKFTEVARVQQNMIKTLKNENYLRIREEEEKRKETQKKFQDSLEEISQSLNKNNEDNNKLRDNNIEMAKKYLSNWIDNLFLLY